MGDINSPQEVYPAIEDKMVCFAIILDKNEGTVYSGLTGNFPLQTYEGYLNLLFAIYVIKTKNNVAMKSRSDDFMVKTFEEV